MLRTIPVLFLLVFLAGCGLSQNRLNHVILVWFNEDVTSEQIAEVKAETLKLARIAEIKSLDAGLAIQSERPIVDDSFDLGVLMQFDSKEAMEAYLGDPRHKAFVEMHIKGKVKRLIIYDF